MPLVPKSAIIRAFHRVLRIIPLYDILCTAVLVVLVVLSFFVEIASAVRERETSATETSTPRVVGNDGRVLNHPRTNRPPARRAPRSPPDDCASDVDFVARPVAPVLAGRGPEAAVARRASAGGRATVPRAPHPATRPDLSVDRAEEQRSVARASVSAGIFRHSRVKADSEADSEGSSICEPCKRAAVATPDRTTRCTGPQYPLQRPA